MNPRALLPAALLVACSSSSGPGTGLCGGGSSATLTVSVVDDTNEPMNVCDATVVATGPTTVTLKPTGGTSNGDCAYVGTFSAGNYTITAMAPGYQTMSIHENVQAGCSAAPAIDVVPTP